MNGLKYSNKIRIVIMAIVALLVLLGLKIKLLTVAAFLILIALLLNENLENGLCVILFLLSFANIFKMSYEGSSFFTYIQIVPLLKLLQSKRTIKKNSLLSIAIIVAYSFFNCFINNQSLSVVVKFSTPVIILILIFSDSENEEIDGKRLILFFSVGVIVAGIIGVFKENIPGLTTYVYSNYSRIDSNTIAYRFSGLSQNPNYYSIDVSIAVAANVILYLRNQSQKFNFGMLIILIILGVLTQSKSFIISLGVILALTLFLSMDNVETNQKIISKIILLAIVFMCLCPLLNLNNYITRFTSIFNRDTNINSFTTGRSDIWLSYLKEIKSSFKLLFIGKGIDTISNDIGIASHNVYIQLVYNYGVIGTIVYLLFLKYIAERKNDKYYIIIVLTIMIRFFGANIAFSLNVFYYYLIAGLLKANIKNEDKAP